MKTEGIYKYIIVAFIAYLINFLPIRNYIYNSSSFLFTGINRDTSSFTQNGKDIFSFIGNIHNIYDQNKKLKSEIVTLQSEKAQNKELTNENAFLRNQLGVGMNKAYTYIVSQIISEQLDGLNNYIVIAKGSRDGIKLNQMVVYNNYLVGVVENVYVYSSQVKLISTLNNSIPVSVLGSNVVGEVVSSINNTLVMNDIYSNENLNIGDTIVTSGIGGNYVPGLIVGNVESINVVTSSPFKSALVVQPFNITDINEVFVLK